MPISHRFGSQCQCERQPVRRPPSYAHFKMRARLRFCLQRFHHLLHFRSEAPLFLASFHGHLDICNFFLVSGADVNAKDNQYNARPCMRIWKCGRDSGFVCNVFIIFFVSGQGLLCMRLLVKATSIFADFLSRRELTSMRKTTSTTPALACTFQNAGDISILFATFSSSSLFQVTDSSALFFS